MGQVMARALPEALARTLTNNSPRGIRKVTFKLDGLEVVGIKWRLEYVELGHVSFKDMLKKDPCCYCLEPSNTWEHVIPRGLGGGDGWDNISRACQSCNNKRDIVPFLIFMLNANSH